MAEEVQLVFLGLQVLHLTDRMSHWIRDPFLNLCDHNSPIIKKQLISERLKSTKMSGFQSQRQSRRAHKIPSPSWS